MITERTTLRTRDGNVLEACLDVGDGAPSGTTILCHAHPKMGGTMNAPLLLALRDDLVARGWGCVRFNFRGVGQSEGTPSLGTDEVNDVAAARDFVRGRFPNVPLTLIGWSFGAAVALRAATEAGAAACVAVAPAVRDRPGLTAGLPPPDRLGLQMPVLVVCGTNDDQTPPADARSWAEEAGAEFIEVPGANHFFWAKYEQLATLVGDWLDGRVRS